MRLSRADIRTKTLLLVGDSSINASVMPTKPPTYFSEQAYNRFIDDAYREVMVKTCFAETERVQDSVADQAAYTVEGILTILGVDYDDRPLEFITQNRLMTLDGKWARRSSRPMFVIVGGSNEWKNDAKTFRLYPTPTVSGDEIRVIGNLAAQPLTNDFYTPALPDWMHDAVALEAAARVLEAAGKQRNQELAAAYRSLRDLYIDSANNRKVDRMPARQVIVGGSQRTPKMLQRDLHIYYTGLAPGDPE